MGRGASREPRSHAELSAVAVAIWRREERRGPAGDVGRPALHGCRRYVVEVSFSRRNGGGGVDFDRGGGGGSYAGNGPAWGKRAGCDWTAEAGRQPGAGQSGPEQRGAWTGAAVRGL